jgi:hypothetical protein
MGDIANEALEIGLTAYWSNQSRCVDCDWDCNDCPFPSSIFNNRYDDDYDDY